MNPRHAIEPGASTPVKRKIDIIMSLVGLVLTAPLESVTALAARVLGRPVLFGQQRPGRVVRDLSCRCVRNRCPRAMTKTLGAARPLQPRPWENRFV